MIELVVALVAILALAAALLQIAELGRARTDLMVEARGDAGELALGPLAPLDAPRYIRDWTPGPDGKQLTADDVWLGDSVAGFDSRIVDRAADGDAQWAVLNQAAHTDLPALHGHPDPVMVFGLVKGAGSETVPLSLAFQHLLCRAAEIEIEAEVWMTYTRDIY
jgi:hypothetical protein